MCLDYSTRHLKLIKNPISGSLGPWIRVHLSSSSLDSSRLACDFHPNRSISTGDWRACWPFKDAKWPPGVNKYSSFMASRNTFEAGFGQLSAFLTNHRAKLFWSELILASKTCSESWIHCRLLGFINFSQAKPNSKFSGYLIVIQDFSSSWC